jgi:hypothetical protein
LGDEVVDGAGGLADGGEVVEGDGDECCFDVGVEGGDAVDDGVDAGLGAGEED